MNDEVWDARVFSKNRDRLIAGEIAAHFFTAVRGQLERSGLLSDEHFRVDGTMLEAWANRRSFREKAHPPERSSGHGGKRWLRDTHESRTDPEAPVGFLRSQRKRKLVEQSFAWIKHWAGLRPVKLHSRRRVEWLFQIAATAYNLVRMRRLVAATV